MIIYLYLDDLMIRYLLISIYYIYLFTFFVSGKLQIFSSSQTPRKLLDTCDIFTCKPHLKLNNSYLCHYIYNHYLALLLLLKKLKIGHFCLLLFSRVVFRYVFERICHLHISFNFEIRICLENKQQLLTRSGL